MALTGLTWSFTWYRTAVYSLFGGTAPKVKNTPRPEYRQKERKDAAKQSRPDRQRHTGREKDRKETTFNYAVWDKAADAVHQLYPTYKSVKLGMEGIEIAPNPNTDRRQTDKIQFDPQTGRLGSITYYKDAPASQTLKGWFYAFIIGGGVAKAGDLLMKPLLENLRKQLFPLLMEDLKILPARFGAEAGLLGAGAMAMDEFMGMGILERFKNQKSTQTFC